MRISEFFETILKAPVRNKQWSWGAVDSKGRVFIRVWELEIEPFNDETRLLVLRDPPLRKSHGLPERKKHLSAIEGGAQGFGVLCRAADPKPGRRLKIASFDETRLLRLGELIPAEPGLVYARAIGSISVEEFLEGEGEE